MRSEEDSYNYIKSLEELKEEAHALLSGSITPFTSSKRTMVKITYNPRSSETKEADFFVTLGKYNFLLSILFIFLESEIFKCLACQYVPKSASLCAFLSDRSL